jgi:trans-aconitate 2-methyltransferase
VRVDDARRRAWERITMTSEWNAAGYARISGLQRQMAHEALALLSLHGGERVLDVGCGQGRITAQIAGSVPRGWVVGVDPSRDMIDYATDHFGTASFANLRFEVADARALPFIGAFDIVVSFNALHWVPEQDTALRSIRRAIEPHGRALLRLVTMGPQKSLETVVEETRKAPRWQASFSDFTDPYLRLTPAQYRAAAERNGFRVIHQDCALKSWDFGSRDAFFAFCAIGLVAWTSRLPDGERAAFVDDVLDRYAAVAAMDAATCSMFRFYQMDATLALA